MKFKLVVLLLAVPILAQLRDLGVIRQKRWLAWDSNEPERIGFKIYAGPTNAVPSGLKLLGLVSSNQWPGSTNRSGLNGIYAVAITAVVRAVLTNVSGTNIVTETNEIESEFSEVVALTFKDGVPIPPGNLQLVTVLQYLATNTLPPIPAVSNEFDLSGR